ncbi:MSLNL protein, partial [Rhinopomastus cyanomelas]|nr:MSLNL protein [Rhinopomastus cyanomelas]
PPPLAPHSLSEVRGGTCGEFYARASRGNLDLLPWGSAQRRGLLRGALGCLGVRSSRLHPEQLRSLGALVCDMEPQTIPASGPSILENLKLCPTLTRPQRDALNALLLAGGTSYGAPSCWDLQTLQDLGPLVMALNQTTLSLVAKAEREALARSIVATYSSRGLAQREKSLTLLRTLVAPSASSDARVKRNADGCSPKPITASTLSDPIFFIYYTPREFELCLTEEVLKSDLELLLEFPLPGSYLGALKNRLEQVYPSGIPEEQLRLLGSFSCLFSVEEISRWPVQSNETLSALLAGGCGAPQAQEMIRRFLELGGAFAGPLLRRMGGEKLCGLPEEELQRLPAALMGVVGQLNISSCSPAKKTLLYRTARAHLGTSGYCWLRPFLGGAPAEDLKALAEGEEPVNMDMETFLSLNPEELQKLSVLDVKNLLGTNLPALKAAENEPLVVLWLEKQSQRDLDCILGIGLRGGTSTPPHPTVSASSTPNGPKPSTLPTGPTAPAVSPSTEPSPPLHTTASSTHQPSPAVVTHSAPSTLVPTSSTPTVSTSPSVPAGTTHPIPPTHSTTTTSTSSAPSTPTVSTS